MCYERFSLPLPSGPCPPADNPEAILLWLYWRHLGSGRISKHNGPTDPFWRRIDEKRRDRVRLTASLRNDPHRDKRMWLMAGLLGLDLADLSAEEQIEVVSDAFVPLRFHLSSELIQLGETVRAAEVLVAAY